MKNKRYRETGCNTCNDDNGSRFRYDSNGAGAHRDCSNRRRRNRMHAAVEAADASDAKSQATALEVTDRFRTADR